MKTALALTLVVFAVSCDQNAAPVSSSSDGTNYLSTEEAQAIVGGRDLLLEGYDDLLRKHVGPKGFVDYESLAAHPMDLDVYVDSLGITSPRFDKLEGDAKLAVLINAYNAFTLKLIVDNYNRFESGEINSITDLHGGKPWDQKIWDLAGQTVSLNQIEHELIRPVFDEPRIHWALVCAAYSCPPLRAEAYTVDRLEAQLADQERRVLLAGDPRFVTTQGSSVTGVSQLFNWYGGDFGPDWKAYVEDRTGHAVAGDRFIAYDWKLNSKANRP